MFERKSAASARPRFPQQFHLIEDASVGLRGAIAIDSLVMGPAAGGCRWWNYSSTEAMHADAYRLARAMTFKNAMAGLPFGGGKSVLQIPDGPFDRVKLFEAFGRAVEALNGDYVVAQDVGTTEADMLTIRSRTGYVAGLAVDGGAAGGDPSPWTALGVFLALREAAVSQLGIGMCGLRVAIQGAGQVGCGLAALLVEAGAKVVVTDIDPQRCEALARDGLIEAVAPDAIASADVDVFAPCALGGSLDEQTIAGLRARLVCGGANNQLAAPQSAQWLLDRGITYVPDYVANAGGIINIAAQYLGESLDQVKGRVQQIPQRIAAILQRAKDEARSPAVIADAMAAELLAQRCEAVT